MFSDSAAPATLQEGSNIAASQARDQSIAGSSKQRRDSSPAQLAFSDQLPVSSQVLLAYAFASMCPVHARQLYLIATWQEPHNNEHLSNLAVQCSAGSAPSASSGHSSLQL